VAVCLSSPVSQLMDKFHKGIELWKTGRIRSAKRIYKEVIEEFSEFIDAYHHLGLVYEEEELYFALNGRRIRIPKRCLMMERRDTKLLYLKKF